jgi:hypothetical protein
MKPFFYYYPLSSLFFASILKIHDRVSDLNMIVDPIDGF